VRPADAYQGIGESLQADVMRFMAIIAFCLIAILALVRSVEPATVEPAAPEPRAVPQPEPAVEVRPADRRLMDRSEAERIPKAAPAPLAPAPAARAPAADLQAPDTPAADAPAVEAMPVAAPRPAAEPARDPGQQLSLRFASDQDFLRLVNRGDIRVFAFADGEVLSVSADFRFEQAPSPRQLHELLPETIPDLMTSALRGARSSASYRWGITLPARMARQIRDHVDRGATGELIIDRFGEVRHHGV
jgi:hypothetical protein